MERSSKRGKIPQSDWPTIMARYEAGETLASIAKTYDCSPPAISYIVSRSRARDASSAVAPPVTEPQLIKTNPHAAPAAIASEAALSSPLSGQSGMPVAAVTTDASPPSHGNSEVAVAEHQSGNGSFAPNGIGAG